MNSASAIQCYPSGVFFDPFEPDIELIRIEDIACALSKQSRFAGHLSKPWLVAQHSLLVSELCPPEFRLCGLLHDVGEAYLVDMPRPIKYHPWLEGYRQLTDIVDQAIAERFGVPWPLPAEVKAADNLMLVCEAHALKHGLDGWHDSNRAKWEMGELSRRDADRMPLIVREIKRDLRSPSLVQSLFLGCFDELTR